MNLEVVCSSRIVELLLAVPALENIGDDGIRMEALLMYFKGLLVEEILAAF